MTKKILVFYDNFGELTLSYADEMISDVYIGDDMVEYNKQRLFDEYAAIADQLDLELEYLPLWD